MSPFAREFEQKGFVALPGFLGSGELSELRDQLDRYHRDVLPRLPQNSAFYEIKGRPDMLKQTQVLGSPARRATE